MGVLLELDERPGVDILNGVIMLWPPHFTHLRVSPSVDEPDGGVSEMLLFLALGRGWYL
jgi:hypothetical protein